jgi:hypothetical protein
MGDYPIRELVLYQNDFVWIAFLGIELRSAGVALAESLCDLGGGGLRTQLLYCVAQSIFLYPRSERKSVGKLERKKG